MKLTDLGKFSSSRLNQKMEQKFGYKVKTDGLTESRALQMLSKINQGLRSYKQQHGNLLSEKSGRYTELLMMRQGLLRWLEEQKSSQHQLLEGEMEQAQTVLAAKDIVDRIQKMLEDTSAMLAEDLPPLLDSIRDQIGSEQAAGFNSSVNAALTSLLENLKQTRESVDGAVRGLTGEAAPAAAPVEPAAGAMPAAPAEPAAGEEEPAAELAPASDLGRETR